MASASSAATSIGPGLSRAYESVSFTRPALNRQAIDEVYRSLLDAELAVPAPEDDSIYEIDFVITGDTFYAADGTRIRIYGIDTPDRGSACY